MQCKQEKVQVSVCLQFSAKPKWNAVKWGCLTWMNTTSPRRRMWTDDAAFANVLIHIL